MSKVYAGRRDFDGRVWVSVVSEGSSRRLRERFDLVNHSPTGFEWGYAGSGPSQLALAILADALNNDDLALRLHQGFKFKVIIWLAPDRDWDLKHHAVLRLAADLASAEGLHLMRIGPRIEAICRDCGSHLIDKGMLSESNGVLAIANGYSLSAIRNAAQLHHGAEP